MPACREAKRARRFERRVGRGQQVSNPRYPSCEAALNGSVGQGRFASASRADYAGAAVTGPRSIEAGRPLLRAC
ncbi:hypothetical protein F6X37_18890 [Paraburkholderia sp. 31.1]|nr:hypothetical protein [Paraburkholderia sp. 31.1]